MEREIREREETAPFLQSSETCGTSPASFGEVPKRRERHEEQPAAPPPERQRVSYKSGNFKNQHLFSSAPKRKQSARQTEAPLQLSLSLSLSLSESVRCAVRRGASCPQRLIQRGTRSWETCRDCLFRESTRLYGTFPTFDLDVYLRVRTRSSKGLPVGFSPDTLNMSSPFTTVYSQKPHFKSSIALTVTGRCRRRARRSDGWRAPRRRSRRCLPPESICRE